MWFQGLFALRNMYMLYSHLNSPASDNCFNKFSPRKCKLLRLELCGGSIWRTGEVKYEVLGFTYLYKYPTNSQTELRTSPGCLAPLSRVEHSHWSRSLEILWFVEPYYAGAKFYAITTHLKASKRPPFRGLLWFLVCFYRMISGFHAQKEYIIGALMP